MLSDLSHNNQQQHFPCFLLLVTCIITRVAGAIFYIEDIDSLRFALAVYNYSLADLQPHFPGYFFYFMLIKPIYWVTQSAGISFAIMGGISIWLLIIYSYKIYDLLNASQNKVPAILLFINPLLLLMSTRYMPDIAGLALLIMGTYYLMHALQYKSLNSAIIHTIIMGFECGLRLSYIPFWLPSILLAVVFFRQLPLLMGTGSLAILFWLIPMLMDTGWEVLLASSQEHAVGHFTEWGGTVMSNNQSYIDRSIAMLESCWADGLGGIWNGRHWLTLLWSFFLLFSFINGLRLLINKWRSPSTEIAVKQHYWLLTICLISYSIWAYFFQNIVYKPRHIMPLLPFLILLIGQGVQPLITKPSKINLILLYSCISIGVFISVILGIQHKTTPSSIAQIKAQITQTGKQHQVLVLCPRLINFYFHKHRTFQTDQLQSMPVEQFDTSLLAAKDSSLVIYSFENMDQIFYQKGIEEHYYHNPYVNRLWSHLVLYRYSNLNQINHE